MLLISYISSQDWHPDYISSYNSLTDRHLRRFFSQPARRRHLGRTNMITPNGDVIAEREWRRQGWMSGSFIGFIASFTCSFSF